MKAAFVAIVAAAMFPLGAAAQGKSMGAEVGAGAGVDADATVGRGASASGSADANTSVQGFGFNSATGSARGGLSAQDSLGRDRPDAGNEKQGPTLGRGSANGNNQVLPPAKTPEELSAPRGVYAPSTPDAAGNRAGARNW